MTRMPCVLIALLVLAQAAAASDKGALDAYDKGKSALSAGRHQEAVGHFERALTEAAESGGSIRIGVKPYEFMPSLKLAEAHLALGNCPQATTRLQAARAAYGSGKPGAAIEALAPRVAACGAATTPAATAPPAVAAATPTPPPCAALAPARQALDRNDRAQARRLALQCLETNAEDADARRIVGQVDSFLDGRMTAALELEGAGKLQAALVIVNEVLAINPGHADATRRARLLEGSIAALPSGTAPATAATAPVRVAVAVPATAPAPSRASAPDGPAEPRSATAPRGSAAESSQAVLPPAVAAFFRGDLDASIRAFEMQAATPQLLTVQACALATRALLQSDATAAEQDLSSARRTWQQALQLQPGLVLDAKWVSPRVREALLGS